MRGKEGRIRQTTHLPRTSPKRRTTKFALPSPRGHAIRASNCYDRPKVRPRCFEGAPRPSGSPPRRCRRLPGRDGTLGKGVMRWTHVLDEYFRHRAAHDLFSGAVLITRGANRLYARAYGYASRAWRVPNTLDTRFDTASVTKLFTAVGTLQLIDRGLLAFDTPVVERLGLETTTLSKDVTVYHLLTHTSGIGDDADEEAGELYEDLWKTKPNYSVVETRGFLPQSANKPPNFP